MNPNQSQLKNIAHNAEDKVSYPYKQQFSGIYTEMKRNGKLKREDSFQKFINPAKLGIDNHM